MFAATPPLQALRLLLSDLATRRRGCSDGRRRGARKALLIDVRKAHLARVRGGRLVRGAPA
eukprot:15182718-Alexandrium_andersonii.AAC.1